ncbi:MAG: ABC transporter permease [Magnetococcales bacterium]|nr:ABC transporter permease [Alphaproteobacteria bacterium]MBF0144162.1 ABC transporter permease [Magnetococcales bacterium]
MSATMIIAGKEVRDAFRNRWVLGATLLLAGLAFVLAFLGSAPTGALDVKPLAVTVVSLASLTIFLVPLIALLLAFDAIVGDVERGTMLLLLTYPVTKTNVVVGKFLGHSAVLAFATVVGYGGAGLAISLGQGADGQSGQAFAWLLASSVLLGMVFLAVAYLISVLVRERGTAAGLAVGVWLFFVVLYDMGLLGLLVAAQDRVGAGVFPYLLLANPTDVYRVFNLTAFENVRTFSGLAGLSGTVSFSPAVLLTVLVAWIVLPLAVAAAVFGRREL